MDWTYSSTKKMQRLLKGLNKRAPSVYAEILNRQQRIVADPDQGYSLSGDLREFRSYDFKHQGIAIRICYVCNERDAHIVFVYCGTRENFYKDVKNYLFH
ncbi:type II toxin-antitoxin system RelE/ParE family toxin [Paenibacillus sp. IB182496]|uniref:Type II toxin-antitoxin system RelE/ParE family toxin n=1 Tax=Paenibacillus sabuli TaxID=2772509 RepID=A0A927BVM2_9BACL|nr:type II toxin-antitoxin system RelE/ParE family toxin [Paenibacillus sabuli]